MEKIRSKDAPSQPTPEPETVGEMCKLLQFSPTKSRGTVPQWGGPRKLVLRRAPTCKLLAERRGGRVPPALRIPRPALSDSDFECDEDTRTDFMTEPQRDKLFSSATGYIRSGSVSSAELSSALVSSGMDDSPGAASSASANSPETWAAVEFEQFVCSVTKSQRARGRSGSAGAHSGCRTAVTAGPGSAPTPTASAGPVASTPVPVTAGPTLPPERGSTKRRRRSSLSVSYQGRGAHDRTFTSSASKRLRLHDID